uniref:Uncharacterized protein n=1 Tax=Knipowitschia caucasica TaxID=637954 RepID=A0AAV2MPF8_KNICA
MDSEELLSYSRADTCPVPMSQLPWVQKQPHSPWLLVHFHGGGFVAQTSRSHESLTGLGLVSPRQCFSFTFPVLAACDAEVEACLNSLPLNTCPP